MSIEDRDVETLTVLLSAERLAALLHLTGNIKSAIELHQKTLRLGADLMTIIATIEIALRNSICENLAAFFGTQGWLANPSAAFPWEDSDRNKIARAVDSARRAEYAKLTQINKNALDALAFPNGKPANLSHLKREIMRRDHIPITDGKVIAELTFYIWKRLYGPDYEHSLWKTTLKKTFPNKKVKRADVAAKLEVLYHSRNRLAHHEPVLHDRFRSTVRSIRYVATHLGAKMPSEQTPLHRLIAQDLAAVEQMAARLHAELDAFRT